MYYFLLNFFCLIYLLWLFYRRYTISLSSYWIVVFYSIYVLVPFASRVSSSGFIPEFIIEKISFYSFVGLVSYIAGNAIFTMFMNDKMGIPAVKNQIVIPFSSLNKLFLFLMSIWIILALLVLGFDGITSLMVRGSREIIVLNQLKLDNFLLTVWQLLFFNLAILSIALVIAASTPKEKKYALRVLLIVILIGFVFSYARRYILYPLIALSIYKLSKLQNRVKVIIYGVLGVLIFVGTMYVMGVVRSYGINEISLASNILLESENPLEILLKNTDFSASYINLVDQILMGNVTANPISYLKVFFMWIPREIYPFKPNYSSIEIFSQINPVASASGVTAATGYIGEALATMGILGIIVISYLWGFICGFIDIKYKKRNFNLNGLRISDFLYIFFGAQFITEAHRGDFGIASLHFVLEVVSLSIVMILSKRIKFSKGYSRTLHNQQ